MAAADGVVIYSPKTKFHDGESFMSFTAIGRGTGDAPYPYEMPGGFVAWRRGVQWQPAAKMQPIRSLRDHLELTRNQPSWGMVFGYGLAACSRTDFALIARTIVPAEQAIPFLPFVPI